MLGMELFSPTHAHMPFCFGPLLPQEHSLLVTPAQGHRLILRVPNLWVSGCCGMCQLLTTGLSQVIVPSHPCWAAKHRQGYHRELGAEQQSQEKLRSPGHRAWGVARQSPFGWSCSVTPLSLSALCSLLSRRSDSAGPGSAHLQAVWVVRAWRGLRAGSARARQSVSMAAGEAAPAWAQQVLVGIAGHSLAWSELLVLP